MEQIENRRKRSQAFSYFLLIIIVLLFLTILGALVCGKLSDIEETAMISWGGTLIGAIGVAISYEWGSSKGSETSKDLAAASMNTSGSKTTISTPSDGSATATVETKP